MDIHIDLVHVHVNVFTFYKCECTRVTPGYVPGMNTSV